MTPEDRKQAFATEYNELVKKYGVVVVARPNIEQMSGGEIVIKLPTVDLALVDNWQSEVEPEKEPSDTIPTLTVDEVKRFRSNGNKEKA